MDAEAKGYRYICVQENMLLIVNTPFDGVPIAASSGELSNALDFHVGTEREGRDTDAGAGRGVHGEVLEGRE